MPNLITSNLPSSPTSLWVPCADSPRQDQPSPGSLLANSYMWDVYMSLCVQFLQYPSHILLLY